MARSRGQTSPATLRGRTSTTTSLCGTHLSCTPNTILRKFKTTATVSVLSLSHLCFCSARRLLKMVDGLNFKDFATFLLAFLASKSWSRGRTSAPSYCNS
ncbi:hypothetical protein ZIOFF_073865 [Zingiber officinale]|uniref:Uncharacterized protein n=1 Tax=Zingiber officinale TaxID=94328 RepID=A0A8J5ETX1_ZINOF|nr:hypothetical protein ZIOFF_073865 [Zingiber officinale]